MSLPFLTIAYMTCRRTPKFEWFASSLHRETGGDYTGIRLVIVDLHAGRRDQVFQLNCPDFKWITPKPNPWQGRHRLANRDWFAAANARNTALCLAPDGWIAYVDDLSVLAKGWLARVRAAQNAPQPYIACGSYRKVRKLKVDKRGEFSFDPFLDDKGRDIGLDRRASEATEACGPCLGGWLFGCSLAAPVDWLLQVNGWPEDLCDGMGFEDCCMGVVLANNGFPLRYDREMLTIESEEHHQSENTQAARKDWHFENGVAVEGGNGADDKSHRALGVAASSKNFPNSFGEGGLRELRRRTLVGAPFPVRQIPDRDWFTGKLLSEL